MSKSPQMEEFLDGMAKSVFGRSRKDNACVTCPSKKVKRNDFRDDLSWKEFQISRMCQKCQDGVFDAPEID